MNFEFSEEQLMLREQARGFLSQHCPPTKVRAVLDGEQDHDADLWQRVAEMGWTATAIPEIMADWGSATNSLSLPKNWAEPASHPFHRQFTWPPGTTGL